jgi:hypothetical protein
MFCFAWKVKAQTYYVIYYESSGTRYYLSINAGGDALERTNELSLRCYWKADAALSNALGQKGIDIYNNPSSVRDWNTQNEKNRKSSRRD